MGTAKFELLDDRYDTLKEVLIENAEIIYKKDSEDGAYNKRISNINVYLADRDFGDGEKQTICIASFILDDKKRLVPVDLSDNKVRFELEQELEEEMHAMSQFIKSKINK